MFLHCKNKTERFGPDMLRPRERRQPRLPDAYTLKSAIAGRGRHAGQRTATPDAETSGTVAAAAERDCRPDATGSAPTGTWSPVLGAPRGGGVGQTSDSG